MEPKGGVCYDNNSVGWILLLHFQSSISTFRELLDSKHRGTIDTVFLCFLEMIQMKSNRRSKFNTKFSFGWILFKMNSFLYDECARISNVSAVIGRSEHIFNVKFYVCVRCWFILKDSVLTKKLWDGSVHKLITGILHRYRCKVLKIQNFSQRPSKKQNQNICEIEFLSRLVLARF